MSIEEKQKELLLQFGDKAIDVVNLIIDEYMELSFNYDMPFKSELTYWGALRHSMIREDLANQNDIV